MRSDIPVELRERYEAIGFAVSQWALAEMALDIVVAEAFRQWGNDCPEPESPKSLRRKLKFLKRFAASTGLNFTDPTHQANARAVITKILAEAQQLGDDRHWLAHGTSSLLVPEALERVELFKTKHGGSDIRVRKSFTVAEIDEMATRAMMLARQLVIFAYAGMKMISEHDFYQMFPDIRSKVAVAFPGSQFPSDDIAEVARDS